MTATSNVQRTGSRRLKPPTGSWADDLWQKWTATPQLARRTEWIILGIITLIGALVRFVRLGQPAKLVFDEVYYVLDSWTLVNLGYEAEWPEDGRDIFAAGDVYAYTADPSYVVHPPLGKYLIGWGMQLFGAENPYAWRITVAVFGLLAIPLLYLVAKKLFNSIGLAAIAAGFLALDGHAIVTSRISILDGLVMFFVLLGFLFLLYDRDDQRRQIFAWTKAWREREHAKDPSIPLEATPSRWTLTIKAPKTPPTGPSWGPILWQRPWLIAMALSLASAASVKWSGAYFLAIFCVVTIGIDAATRKEAGITFWLSGAVLKQGWASFLLTIPLSVALYLLTFIGWFRTGAGYYANWVQSEVIDGAFPRAWGGMLEWVPLSFQNFWHYQSEVLKFHSGLGADHPYTSAPIQWPFLLRPTAFSYDYFDRGENGCTAQQCVEAITSLSNPLFYWLGTVAIVFLVMMLFVKPRWEYVAVIIGYAAGYLPWLITGRTAVYHFYVIAWLPFMFLAAALALQTIAGTPKDDRRMRTPAVNIVAGFLVLGIFVSLVFYPVWSGIQIPTWYWHLTHWLPGWR
ncbi:dolichyl-phosphate-mannose--protein mannosyltransferase [Gulosibacter chungangensis]|uniref:dolichyl-phosphate-mannose--protein mannosyltransferase n=1 Tax=Gulosibacter chungangensis TaxID=979746 RepID=UPI0017888801|nr:phospholipid carrier-dependent glycosyltransferase [Gulosibacter chungangensis]